MFKEFPRHYFNSFKKYFLSPYNVLGIVLSTGHSGHTANKHWGQESNICLFPKTCPFCKMPLEPLLNVFTISSFCKDRQKHQIFERKTAIDMLTALSVYPNFTFLLWQLSLRIVFSELYCNILHVTFSRCLYIERQIWNLCILSKVVS